MTRQELAQWHREQAEILDSGKPLVNANSGLMPKCAGFSRHAEYRLAPERKPIPDYDLTESEVKGLIKQGFTHVAQDRDTETYVYGVGCYADSFERIHDTLGYNRYTGPDWRESLRTLKDYV